MSASTAAQLGTVGRHAEREGLRSAAARAFDGSGGLVLLSGPAGIGKSHLLRSLADHWQERGGAVLAGRGVPLVGTSLAFSPWRQAARNPKGATEQSAHTVSLILERLRSRHLDSDFLVEDVWSHLLEIARNQPLLICLDDAQWCDTSSLNLIAAGLAEVESARIAVAIAFRDDEPSCNDSLEHFLVEWARFDWTQQFRLTGLAHTEVRELGRRMLGIDAPAIESVIARSAGNPYYAINLLASSPAEQVDGVPVALAEFLVGRMRHAGTDILRVVQIIALNGPPLHLRVLAHVLGASDVHTERVVLRASRAGLLRLEADVVAVTHDLVGEAAVHELGPIGRRAVHRRLAQAHENAMPEGSMAGHRATHWKAAGDALRSVPCFLDAAKESAVAADYPERLHHLRSALSEIDRMAPGERARYLTTDMLAETAEAAYRSGDSRAAVRYARQALTLTHVGVERVNLLLQLATYQRTSGDGRGALETAHSAYLGLRDIDDARTVVAATAGYAAALLGHGEYAEAGELARGAVESAAGIVTPALLSALITLGSAIAIKSDLAVGLRYLGEAIELAQANSDPEAELRAVNNRSFVLQNSGHLSDAATDALNGLLLARERRLDRGAGALLLANLVECLDWLGRWDEALSHIRAGVDGAPSTEVAAGLHGTEARILTFRGNLSAARLSLDLALSAVEGSHVAGLHAQLAVIGAELELAERNPHAAVLRLDDALRELSEVDEEVEGMPIAVLALLAASADPNSDSNQRLALVDRMSSVAQRLPTFGTARDNGMFGAWQATFAAIRSDLIDQPDPELWARTVLGWRRVENPLWQARSLLRLAALQARIDRDHASRTLAEAEDLARKLNARPLLDDIEALRARARLHPVIPQTTQVSPGRHPQLTARELQVMALLLRGETNRKIGRTLFISERTAGVHVSNILQKLDAKNRGAAAATAYRLGLVNLKETS